MVTLAWIKTNQSQPVFITNRVKEIRTYLSYKFRYISGKENPANLSKKGCRPTELKTIPMARPG